MKNYLLYFAHGDDIRTAFEVADHCLERHDPIPEDANSESREAIKHAMNLAHSKYFILVDGSKFEDIRTVEGYMPIPRIKH